MAKIILAPKKAAAADLAADPPQDFNSPVNVIHDQLNQAHATLDMLYALTTADRCATEPFETLCKNTLSSALHGSNAADRRGHRII